MQLLCNEKMITWRGLFRNRIHAFVNKNGKRRARFDATIRFSTKSYIPFVIFIGDKTIASETKRGKGRRENFWSSDERHDGLNIGLIRENRGAKRQSRHKKPIAVGITKYSHSPPCFRRTTRMWETRSRYVPAAANFLRVDRGHWVRETRDGAFYLFISRLRQLLYGKCRGVQAPGSKWELRCLDIAYCLLVEPLSTTTYSFLLLGAERKPSATRSRRNRDFTYSLIGDTDNCETPSVPAVSEIFIRFSDSN